MLSCRRCADDRVNLMRSLDVSSSSKRGSRLSSKEVYLNQFTRLDTGLSLLYLSSFEGEGVSWQHLMRMLRCWGIHPRRSRASMHGSARKSVL